MISTNPILSNIRPYLSSTMHSALKGNVTDQEIQKLFSEGGLTRSRSKEKGGNVTFKMTWHTDPEGNKGIIVQAICKNDYLAWIKPNAWKKQHNFIWVTNRKTLLKHYPKTSDFIPLFFMSSNRTDEAPVKCDIYIIDQPDAIEEYFNKHNNLVPKSILENLFGYYHINDQFVQEDKIEFITKADIFM